MTDKRFDWTPMNNLAAFVVCRLLGSGGGGVERAILGFELELDCIKDTTIAIHLASPPRRLSLLHLQSPVNCEDGRKDVEGPAT